MFPFDQLSGLFSLSKIHGADGWYSYEVKTPAHRFLNVVKWYSSKELCCQFTVRDTYLDGLLIKLVHFTDEHEARLSDEKHIAKLPYSVQGFSFTTVVYLNCECHNAFKVQIPSLHTKTLVAFPSFDCEFSGDETPDVINFIRRDFLATVDWNRKPVPKILMRYANQKTKSKSTGKKLGLASVDTLINEVKNLENAPESFIEIENFKHQQCRILSRGNKNHISFGDLELSPSDTINFVNRFTH